MHDSTCGVTMLPEDCKHPAAPAVKSGMTRPNYALAVLTFVAFTALLDRYLISLLLEPIRSDFVITDTQASLLQGLAFAFFYSLLGLPFGRWVDRGNRRNILLFAVLCWSGTTMLCGLAPNYGLLFLARLGVGIGEACLAPAAYSYITDVVPSQRHGRAFAIFAFGIGMGSAGSFIVGAQALRFATFLTQLDGPLALIADWRLTFFLVGALGMPAALLVLTLSEPPRRRAAHEAGQTTLAELGVFLRRIATPFCAILFTGAATIVAGTAIFSWLAVFLWRTYAVPTTVGGNWIGFATALACVAATMIGARLSDSRWIAARTGEKCNVVVMSCLVGIPFAIIFPLAPAAGTAMFLYVFLSVCFNIQSGMLPAALQDIVPNRFKGQASAIYWLCAGLIGIGCGSTIVALVTDHVFGSEADLRYAMAIVSSTSLLLAAVSLLISRRSYQRVRDLHKAELL